MKQEYIEKIYAGWLAKIIGIRLGAPIEGWAYEKIKNVYGEADGYLLDYQKCFAADDDSNGPLFFLRALADRDDGCFDLTAGDVERALLNYLDGAAIEIFLNDRESLTTRAYPGAQGTGFRLCAEGGCKVEILDVYTFGNCY